MPGIARCLLGLFLILALAACGDGSRRDSASLATPAPTPAALARITGQVSLAGQEDFSGAQVYVPGTSLVAVTDRQGYFALDRLGPGTYRVEARADGYTPAPVGEVTIGSASPAHDYPLVPVTLQPKEPQPQATSITALGSLAGQLAVAGGPVGGLRGIDWTRCTIALEGTDYRTAGQADGRFLLWNLPPDDYRLTATLEGFAPIQRDVRVLPGAEPTSVTLEFPAQGSGLYSREIRGQVELRAADGTLATDYSPILVEAANHPELATRPGPDGRFLLTNLAPDHYVMTASGAGYNPSDPVDVDLTSGPMMNVKLTLTAIATTTSTTAVLRGAAVKNDEAVTDQSGITIALEGTSLVAVSDAEGGYALNNIPPGTYTLIASADGFEPARLGPLTLAAGAQLEADTLTLEPQRQYPEVLTTDPGDGTRDFTIRHEMVMTVRFSKKMNPDSLRQAVRIEPDVAFGVYAGKERPNTDFDLAQIVLAGTGQEPVARYRTRYTVTIGTEATDVEGLSLQEPFSTSFTTGAPAVIGSQPADSAVMTDVSPVTPVTVQFNAPIDRTTLGPRSIRIRPALTQAPVLSTQEDNVSGWTNLLIQGQWQADTEYRVTIEGRVRTANNVTLANTPYTFTFRTAKITPMQGTQRPGAPGRTSSRRSR